jgi:hypothetical protein
MKKQILQKTKIAIIALIFSMCFTYVSASWMDAPPNPPGNNVPAPINVGQDSQTKTGYFEVTKDTTGKPGTWAFSVPNGASWFKAVGTGLISTKNIYLGAPQGESTSIYFAPRNAGYESLDAMLVYSSSKGHLGFWDGSADGISGSEVLTINNGKIGIGNASPTERLTVNGNVRVSDWLVSGGLSASALQITGGSPAVGKVLTSDGQGNATWQASSPTLKQTNCSWTVWFRQEIDNSPVIAPVGSYVAGIDYRSNTGGPDGSIRFYYCSTK